MEALRPCTRCPSRMLDRSSPVHWGEFFVVRNFVEILE
jgi:hypothetical protein